MKKNLEVHHIIQWETCREHKEGNLVILHSEIHDIIHRPLYIYDTSTVTGQKKNYINKINIKYNLYKEQNNIEIINTFLLYKLIKYKRSGISKTTKSEIKMWVKYIKFLIKSGYDIELILFNGNAKVTLDYVILSAPKE